MLAACRFRYDAVADDQFGGGSAGTASGGVGGASVGGAVVGGLNADAGDASQAGDMTSGGTGTPLAGGGAGGEAGAASGGTAGSGGSSGSAGSGGSGGSGGTSGAGGMCVTNGPEVCDGVDNDCSGAADDGGVCRAGCVGQTHAGHKYAFCSTPLSRAAAAASCQAMAEHLVKIEDASEKDWLRSICFAGLGTDNASAVWRWIGASDLVAAGQWRWADGTQFWQGGPSGSPVSGRYGNWAPAQPSNLGDCVAMQNNVGDSFWWSQDCALSQPYICETE